MQCSVGKNRRDCKSFLVILATFLHRQSSEAIQFLSCPNSIRESQHRARRGKDRVHRLGIEAMLLHPSRDPVDMANRMCRLRIFHSLHNQRELWSANPFRIPLRDDGDLGALAEADDEAGGQG